MCAVCRGSDNRKVVCVDAFAQQGRTVLQTRAQAVHHVVHGPVVEKRSYAAGDQKHRQKMTQEKLRTETQLKKRGEFHVCSL